MKIELEMKITNESQYDIPLDIEALKNLEKHEVLFSPESSSLYACTRSEASLEYDYEVNSIRIGEENSREYMYIKASSKIFGDKFIRLDPEINLSDTLLFSCSGDEKLLDNGLGAKLAKANIFKRLVSKKKRRLQTPYYDLDMAYITERVIGMGFPSTGCESLYRNNLMDIKGFLDRYHGEYKIYNLCIEKKRIYPKEYWIDRKVGLFPFNDHAPCPIKLILDFCVDICLYLTSNPRGVAAIHCKAGKGRTGVMIVCYLIFSGLCETVEEALEHYAKQRTLNGKGVTISSQIRYIKYFETFLSATYERPFLRCIPKIIRFDLNKGYTNMIMNYNTDMSYFSTINNFMLKKILIGPFSEDIVLKYDFSAITRKKLNFENSKIIRKFIDNGYYYEIDIESDEVINYDLKLAIKSKKVSFYSWFNLWFNTFDIISNYIVENKYFDDSLNDQKLDTNINSALSHIKSGIDYTVGGEVVNSNSALSSLIKRQSKGKGGKRTALAFNKLIGLYSKKKKKKSALNALKNNKDLNNILEGIDDLAKEKGIPVIDRNHLEFVIERNQLDKLKTKLKDDFRVKYSYQLLK